MSSFYNNLSGRQSTKPDLLTFLNATTMGTDADRNSFRRRRCIMLTRSTTHIGRKCAFGKRERCSVVTVTP